MFNRQRMTTIGVALLLWATIAFIIPDIISFSLGTIFGLLAFFAYLLISLRI